MRILREMGSAPATVTLVARRIGVHPANLSRHLRILEAAGLIERVRSGGGAEKYYRAVADRFEVAPDEGAHASGRAIALAMVRSDLAVAESRLAADDSGVVTALLGRARISQNAAAAFAAELHALVLRFREQNDDGGEAYHINVSLYPGGAWDGPPGTIELNKGK